MNLQDRRANRFRALNRQSQDVIAFEKKLAHSSFLAKQLADITDCAMGGHSDRSYQMATTLAAQFPSEPVVVIRRLSMITQCKSLPEYVIQNKMGEMLTTLQGLATRKSELPMDERSLKVIFNVNRYLQTRGWTDLQRQLLDTALLYYPDHPTLLAYQQRLPAIEPTREQAADVRQVIARGGTTMIATILAEASQSVVGGRPNNPCFARRDRFGEPISGLDLGLYWLAAGARACRHEPVFPLYRAAFSIDHPRMSNDNKLQQVRLATAAIEEATHSKLYNHRLGSDTELKLVARLATFCRTASEYYMGIRLLDAAQPYFPKDTRVLPTLRERLLQRPGRLNSAQLPPALNR